VLSQGRGKIVVRLEQRNKGGEIPTTTSSLLLTKEIMAPYKVLNWGVEERSHREP